MIPEFGNSLGGVLSATQALLNGAAADPRLRQELLGEMEKSLRRMHRLYENWIIWNAHSQGRLRLHRQRVRAGEWLEGLAAAWGRDRTDGQISWSWKIPGTLPVLRLDVALMERALANVLHSALQSGTQNPQVRVAGQVSEAGTHLRITVRDPGPPLPPAVFEAPLQGPGRTQEQPRLAAGAGLGLAVASAVIRRHGGTLQTAPDEASANRFTIEIPIA